MECLVHGYGQDDYRIKRVGCTDVQFRDGGDELFEHIHTDFRPIDDVVKHIKQRIANCGTPGLIPLLSMRGAFLN